MEAAFWLTEPIKKYDEIFHILGISTQCVQNFKDFIVQHLCESSANVPLITSETLPYIPDGHLVCVKGMVQDMFDSELYMSSYRLVGDLDACKSTRYRDVEYLKEDTQLDESSITLASRQSFFISHVPGESSWVEAARPSNICLPSAVSGTKRISSTEPGATPPPVKKPLSDVVAHTPENMQKPKVREHRDGVILRVYDDKEADSLKLTDLVFVYGILEHARLGSEPISSNEGATNESTLVDANVTKKFHLPRVHAIAMERASYSSHPWLLQTLSSTESMGLNLSTARMKLLSILSSVLKGDKLAAECVLLHLLSTSSKLNTAYPSTLPSLNISNWDGKSDLDKESFMRILESVLPHLSTILLTIDALNSGPLFMSVRDVSTGELDSGLLQLPNGSQILVDETKLVEGQLSTRGLLNVRALTMLATQRKLTYDFQFYTQDWDADIRVVILSSSPSIIKPVYTIPLQISTENDELKDISDEDFRLIRRYLMEARLLEKDYSIDNELQKVINADFVNWRKEKSTFVEAEDFAVMLCLLKLYTLSVGTTCANLDHWRIVVSMERERLSRSNIV